MTEGEVACLAPPDDFEELVLDVEVVRVVVVFATVFFAPILCVSNGAVVDEAGDCRRAKDGARQMNGDNGEGRRKDGKNEART